MPAVDILFTVRPSRLEENRTLESLVCESEVRGEMTCRATACQDYLFCVVYGCIFVDNVTCVTELLGGIDVFVAYRQKDLYKALL
ncbi:unnamed protein product [Enterobius vermicularis]|uniref:Phlebovirus_G2 domain-containing protein n=1 Tax=Enterobius vermicularis TaxID=51028 RepID=A0A0N4VRF3_ENTVE|nr:unnamed protein product [Enterobius vermicularis]